MRTHWIGLSIWLASLTGCVPEFSISDTGRVGLDAGPVVDEVLDACARTFSSDFALLSSTTFVVGLAQDADAGALPAVSTDGGVAIARRRCHAVAELQLPDGP